MFSNLDDEPRNLPQHPLHTEKPLPRRPTFALKKMIVPMRNSTDDLVEEFAKLGFDFQDLAPSLLEIQPALSVYQTRVFDSRTTRPTDYFHFAFELWQKTPDDPLKITCLSVGLIGRGPDSKEDLLATGYYHIDQGGIPSKETVLTEVLNTHKRIEARQKFNMGGSPPPSLQPKQNLGRSRKE